MEFLHLSPGGKSFEEFIAPGVDKTSWMRNLDKKRSPELDKNAAKEVMTAMEQLLSWLPDELSSIVEWCRTLDALYDPLILSLTLGNWLASWESWKSISANGKIQIRLSLSRQ